MVENNMRVQAHKGVTTQPSARQPERVNVVCFREGAIVDKPELRQVASVVRKNVVNDLLPLVTYNDPNLFDTRRNQRGDLMVEYRRAIGGNFDQTLRAISLNRPDSCAASGG